MIITTAKLSQPKRENVGVKLYSFDHIEQRSWWCLLRDIGGGHCSEAGLAGLFVRAEIKHFSLGFWVSIAGFSPDLLYDQTNCCCKDLLKRQSLLKLHKCAANAWLKTFPAVFVSVNVLYADQIWLPKKYSNITKLYQICYAKKF